MSPLLHRVVPCLAALLASSLVAEAKKPAPPPAPAPKAAWTLMIYMDADNNLEAPELLANVADMINVGSTPQVNIVLLIDRSPKGEDAPGLPGYTNKPLGGLPNWSDAKLVYADKGKLRELADWGEVNMGDPNTLVKFVTAAEAQYPAQRYALILGDHGAGINGIASDETSNEDILDVGKLTKALRTLTDKAGPLDVVGFDACLMGTLEVARIVAPFAKTMVASEELEPGLGWWYADLLPALEKHPEADGAAFGKMIVSAYESLYRRPELGQVGRDTTLSAIDLSKVEPLIAAVNDLSTRNEAFVKASPKNLLTTARARANTEEYAKRSGAAAEEFEYDNLDLGDYAANIKAQSGDAGLATAADGVTAALRAAVIAKTSGAGKPHANGLSIWFPKNKKVYGGFPYQVVADSFKLKWGSFLGSYTSAIGKDTQPPAVEPVHSSDVDLAKSDLATVTAKIDADDVDEATFVLARKQGAQTILIGEIAAEPDDKGVLHEEWDGGWFTIGDGKTSVFAPITDFDEIDAAKDLFEVQVPVQVQFGKEKDWHDVTLTFEVDFSHGSATGVFVEAVEYDKKECREFDLEPGDSVRPVYVVVDAKGVATETPATDPATTLHLTKANDLRVGHKRAPAGDYQIGFRVTDFAGNANDTLVDVKIE